MKIAKLEIARVAHEVNRAYRLAIGEDAGPVWEESPDWQRESVLAGVQAILDDPTITPAHSHAKWNRYKLEEGWEYGEEKDPVLKTHPCLVPWNHLPLEQQAKDSIFGAIVRALR